MKEGRMRFLGRSVDYYAFGPKHKLYFNNKFNNRALFEKFELADFM